MTTATPPLLQLSSAVRADEEGSRVLEPKVIGDKFHFVCKKV